jgi:hypothetical protein
MQAGSCRCLYYIPISWAVVLLPFYSTTVLLTDDGEAFGDVFLYTFTCVSIPLLR